MTSVWFSSAGRVELRDDPKVACGSDDVRVQALASAISHGTEMLVYRGQVPPETELDLPTLQGSFAFPIKYGYASVGAVTEVGNRVAYLHTGDTVFVHHPHQSEYVVPAGMAIRLPTIDPQLGCFLANVETAINIVIDAAPRFGERVAVFGQGVVGLLITQLLRRIGVSLIVAIEPVARRRELALQLGADVALAASEIQSTTFADLTGGTGVDVAIEASGVGAALAQAVDSLAFGGSVGVCSWYGTKPVSLPLGGGFHRRRLRIVSSQVSSIDSALQPRWSHARRLEVALQTLPCLQLEPLISHRLPIERAAEAYALIDTQPDQTVQVVLTYP